MKLGSQKVEMPGLPNGDCLEEGACGPLGEVGCAFGALWFLFAVPARVVEEVLQDPPGQVCCDKDPPHPTQQLEDLQSVLHPGLARAEAY